jgi:hypothetical protein
MKIHDVITRLHEIGQHGLRDQLRDAYTELTAKHHEGEVAAKASSDAQLASAAAQSTALQGQLDAAHAQISALQGQLAASAQPA